jgi:hypothetical protein
LRRFMMSSAAWLSPAVDHGDRVEFEGDVQLE